MDTNQVASITHTPLPDVSGLIHKLVETQGAKLLAAAPKIAGKAFHSLQVRSGNALKGYLTQIGPRMYTLKTLIYEDEPTPITQFYVPPSLSNRNNRFHRATLADITESSGRLLVTGTAGSGKSTAFRHFFLEHLAYGDSAPVFVNLRDVNSSPGTLIRLISSTIAKFSGTALSEQDVTQLCAHGLIALFLDGLDEVLEAKREELAAEIRAFSTKHPHVKVLVSSRPIDHATWDTFNCLEVLPMTIDDAVELVSKLDFDKDDKEKFIKLLRAELYASHESFASNPLLLSLMLLMFFRNAEIPRKWHLFYAQAYETLFHRHDAKKPGGYRRVYSTGLAIDDFEKVFASLCIICFQRGLFSMPIGAIRTHISEAIALSELKIDVDDFLRDSEKQVCLIMQDGLEYRFTHKTFIEYFSARYFSYLRDQELQSKIIESLGIRAREPGFLISLHAENCALAEESVLIPVLESALKSAEVLRFDSDEACSAYLRIANPRIEYSEGQVKLIVMSNPITDAFRLLSAVGIIENSGRSSINWDEVRARFSLRYGEKSRVIPLGRVPKELRQLVVAHPWMGSGCLSELQLAYDRMRSRPSREAQNVESIVLAHRPPKVRRSPPRIGKQR